MSNVNRIAILLAASLIISYLSVGQTSFLFASYTHSTTISASGTIIENRVETTRIRKLLVAYGVSSPLSQDLIVDMAKFDMMDTDFGIGPDVEKIKAINPSIIILGYKDVMAMNAYMEDWNEANTHEDWFMHDLKGSRIQIDSIYGWYLMDISSQGWRQHYADYVKEKIDLYSFDGVFADDVWTHLFRDAWTVPPEDVPDWNYVVNGYTYWQTRMREFLSYVKSRIGNSLLIYNGPSNIYLDVSDGKTRENFVFHRPPLDDINDLTEISATGKYYLASPYALPEDTGKNFLYAFCCFLLGVKGSNAYFSWKNIYAKSQGYYPQMDFDFGSPVGPYYLVEGVLYGRDFDHAKVFVNLSEMETYTVEVEGESYTLEPKSGVILV